MWANFEFLDLHNASRKLLHRFIRVVLFVRREQSFFSAVEANRKDMVYGCAGATRRGERVVGWSRDGVGDEERLARRRHVCLNEYRVVSHLTPLTQ